LVSTQTSARFVRKNAATFENPQRLKPFAHRLSRLAVKQTLERIAKALTRGLRFSQPLGDVNSN
jgi:hypothetical protein